MKHLLYESRGKGKPPSAELDLGAGLPKVAGWGGSPLPAGAERWVAHTRR